MPSPSPKRNWNHWPRLNLCLACLHRPNRQILGCHPLRDPLLQRRSHGSSPPRRITRLQSIARRVRRVISIHLLRIFNSRRIPNQGRQYSNQFAAVLGNVPLARVQHLVHQHPAANPIILSRSRPRQSRRRKNISHLLRNRSLVRSPRKRIRRKINRLNLFPRFVRSPASTDAPRNDLAR